MDHRRSYPDNGAAVTHSVEVGASRYTAELQDGKWYVLDAVTNMRLGPYWNAKEMAAYWNGAQSDEPVSKQP
jgi:hypothetical protein